MVQVLKETCDGIFVADAQQNKTENIWPRPAPLILVKPGGQKTLATQSRKNNNNQWYGSVATQWWC